MCSSVWKFVGVTFFFLEKRKGRNGSIEVKYSLEFHKFIVGAVKSAAYIWSEYVC